MSENTVSQKRMRLRKKLSKNGMFYGDNLVYIIIHNIFSVILFFSLTFSIGLFSGVMPTTGPLEAVKFYLDIAFISFVCGVIGRSLAIFFMKFVIEKATNTVLRGSKDYTTTQGVSFLLIGIIGLVSILGNLELSYYIFGLLALLYLAVNKFSNKSLVFIISSLVSSFLWIIGMLSILQTFLFTKETIWTAIITYFLIKTATYIVSKIIVDSRL
jgi:hypothetical protein